MAPPTMPSSITIPCPPELRRQAEAAHRRPEELAEEAIAEYLEAAAVKAGLDDIGAGRLIPGKDIDAWLASWGDEDELPPPSCPE